MSLRKEIIEKILNSKEPREAGKQLAKEHNLNFGLVWQKVLMAAKINAKESITSARLNACLSDAKAMKELMTEIYQDRTLVKENYLDSFFYDMQLTSAEYKQLLEILPIDREYDSSFETLFISDHAPVEIILQLIKDGRMITAIAHKKGPEVVLLAVANVYAYDEPVLTLISRFYMAHEYPIEKLLAFVNIRKKDFGESIFRMISNNDKFPSDKVEAVSEILCDYQHWVGS